MTTPELLPRLRDAAESYDALLCDIWGVIHNGREGFPEAIEAIARFRESRGPVGLISNSPRPAEAIPAQFAAIGVPTDLGDAIATSGDATRHELKRRAPGPAFALGPDRDAPIYDGAGLAFAPLEEAAFISCTGLFDDATEAPEDYRALFERALARDLPMVCANPDIQVVRGGQRIWCAGALARLYDQMGGQVILAGKPFAPIYRLAFEKLNEAAGRKIPPKRILAIGDSLANDVAGANAHGLDVMFVTGGVNGAENYGAGAVDMDRVKAELSQRGLTARYVSPVLAW